LINLRPVVDLDSEEGNAGGQYYKLRLYEKSTAWRTDMEGTMMVEGLMARPTSLAKMIWPMATTTTVNIMRKGKATEDSSATPSIASETDNSDLIMGRLRR
jgi:hypothetical protein